jgi:hypothetical protein
MDLSAACEEERPSLSEFFGGLFDPRLFSEISSAWENRIPQ